MVHFLDGEVRVEDGYVFVRNESVPHERRAREILAAVDRALEIGNVRSVMFDTRDMEGPPEEVNAILRAWVDACHNHDKVALLVRSDLKRIASNMRALSVGVKLRSFSDRDEAIAWLRKPVLRPPVGRIRAPTKPATAKPKDPKQAAEQPGKRRWQSPLLQQLNED